MFFVLVGVLMLLMQSLGIGPLAEWTWADDWMLLLAPFGLAVVWWFWCDVTGFTQKQAMKRDQNRRDSRRQKAMDAIGLKKDHRK